ncbi:MAG: flippase [Bacteroidetes bacterium]|nr:flippase [Bacteroidota bacterium]
MNSDKKIIQNTVYRWSGEIINKVIWFLFIVFIARHLNSSGFGFFNYAFSFASMIIVLTDMGTNTLITKEVSKNYSKSGVYLSNVFFLKIVFSIVLLSAISVFAVLFDEQPAILILISLSLLISAFLDPLNSIYRAHSSMIYETVVLLLWRFMIAGFSVMGLYWYNQGLLWISLSFIAAGITALIISLVITKKKFMNEIFSFKHVDIRMCRSIIKESVPIGLLVVVSTIFYKLNIVLLQYISNSDEVAWYSASFKLIEAGFFVPTIFIAAIFPYLCRENSKGKISSYAVKLLKRSAMLLILIAAGIAVVMLRFSSEIIVLLYGKEFIASAGIMKIVALMPFFIFLNELLFITYVSIEKQKTVLLMSVFPLCLYLFLCFVLIPGLKSEGAAWALLISQAVLLAINLVYFKTLQSNIVKIQV